MKKVMRKSKRKRDLRKREHRGRGIVAKTIRFLDRWYTWAHRDKNRHGESVAIRTFIDAHIRPYKERGDQYLLELNKIRWLFLTDPPSNAELPGKVEGALKHLHELRTDRLNYDDMRAALEKLHVKPWPWYARPGKQWLLESSGASNALIGAPVSDEGAMRNVLKEADYKLTEAVKAMDDKAPRDAVMAIWEVIHASRKALKAKHTDAATVTMRL